MVDEDHYLNLSRKELQWLCKKHGLSANKTNSQLAELLVCFYKGQDAGLASIQEDISTGCEEFSPSQLPKSELKVGGPFKSSDECNKVCKTQVEAVSGDYVPSSCSKGMGGGDRIHSQTVSQEEINNHRVAQPLDEMQLAESSGNVIHTDVADNRTTKGVHCSKSNPGNKETESMVYLNAIIPSSTFGSEQEESGVKNRTNEPLNPLEPRNFDGCLLNPTNNRVGSVPQIQCSNMEIGANPAENSAVSSNKASMEARPASFQFFVTSEEGINLYVDLTSSPSDWIGRLKDEVSMYKKVHYSKSRVLHKELGCLGDGDECIKASMAECPDVSIQAKEVERNTDSVCMRSSLSSINVANSHYGAHHPDAAIEHSSSNPMYLSGHPSDDKRVISSTLWKPDSDVQSEVGPTCAFPQSSAKMTTCTDGLNCPSSLECRTSKSTSTYHKSAEALFVGISNMVSGVSEKSNLLFSGDAHEGFSPCETGCLEKHSEACQGSSVSGAIDMHSSRGTSHFNDTSTSPQQFGSERNLVSPPDDIQSGNVPLVDRLPDMERCNGYGSPIPEDPLSAFPEEQVKGALLNEEESSDCLQPLVMASKRTHDSKFPEELQSKRQCNDSEDDDNGDTESAMKNLRSSRSSTREQMPPRRSMRLVPKV